MRQLTREKALTERELEWLLLGAGRIEDNGQQMEAWASILIGARLGLRAGELTHLNESWVNLRRQMIHIPSHDPCTKGRDGGPCGSCTQAAKQSATHNPESVEGILEDYWRPKTDAAVRDIPFGFAPRVAVAVEWLIDEYSGWPHSFSTLQRRLDQALECAPELDRDSTTLHGLRGTAASFHAGRGLDPGPLQSMFGWSDLQTARNYIAVDGEMTRRALSEVHG
jgi:integrase